MFAKRIVCAALALPLWGFARTAGWEDINPNREEVSPAKVVWTADVSSAKSFTFEQRAGAKGDFSIRNGKICITKKNAAGWLVLKGRPFAQTNGTRLRMFADVEADASNPDCAMGFVRAHGKAETLQPCYKAEVGNFSGGGRPSMIGLRNSAPGTPYRKYAHFLVEDGVVTPMIVIGGTPSTTKWTNWTFEDLAAAQEKWKRIYAERTARDNSAARIDEAAFDRMIAADFEHVAEIRAVDGVSRLFVDDEVSLPVVYNSKSSFGDDATMETFRGDSLVTNGVKLMVRGVNMGGGPGNPRNYWTAGGFDAVAAVRDFKDGMRIAPGALFIVRLSCNAYPEYTAEHPEEVWKTEDGKVVKGTSGSCVVGYDDMGIPDTNRWPWISYSSRRWREDVKANIRALVAEFRRQGLDKRIVGIHTCGYHDGQFSAPYPDFSDCAKREYAAYLGRRPVYTNYHYFVKQEGFRAQEEFAREFKRALGKKTVAIRWCEAPFSASEYGGYDLTSFVHSDVIDVAVPQPPYERRHPGLAFGPKLPQASFHLHGKMFWSELDLRTYGALESWASSVVSTKGLGQQDDIVAWRSAYRKLAGQMMALRSGFWLYDMGGGWFSPPEIAADIGESVRTMESYALRTPRAWRPGVAFVVDEANPAVFGDREDLKLPLRGHLIHRNWPLYSASGVPYETFLADDVLERPELLKDTKMVVLALFRHFDARRSAFVRRLRNEGKTILFLAECGIGGGDAETMGFETVFNRNNCSHEIVAADGVLDDCASVISATWMSNFQNPKAPYATAVGPRVSVRETQGLRVIARYREDNAPAVASRQDGPCRRIYVGEYEWPSAALLNRFAREAGAYVPHAGTGIQVDMNGDFISVHALRSGHYNFRLPFPCSVVNLKSGRVEPQANGEMPLELTAGETCWFRLDSPQAPKPDLSKGWTNEGSGRRISDPDHAVVWRAPFEEGAEAFEVVCRYGAKVDVKFDRESVTIAKTNDLGYVFVYPRRPFRAGSAHVLRTAVREECRDAVPLATRGAVYLYGPTERLSCSELDNKQWCQGRPRNAMVINTAPGVGEWKYGLFQAEATNGFAVTPAIFVSGPGCTTRWSSWSIEDYAEVKREWTAISEAARPPDRMKDALSLDVFERKLAAEPDHVAKMEKVGGRAVLMVDGKAVPPVIYKSRSRYSISSGPVLSAHAGLGMEKAGVSIQSCWVQHNHWWPDGVYNFKGAAEDVRRAMRIAPDSLFVITLHLNPYDRFAVDHPDERWIGRDGLIVCGGGGACHSAVRPGEPWPKWQLPCTSYSSVLWRETAKRNISLLADELKRTGLAKRVIGVHIAGFEDCQFSNSYFPDFSPSALAAYRKAIGDPKATIPEFGTNQLFAVDGDFEQKRWLDFIKREPCRLQNDIARHAKACFGKDMIAIRWCYGPFSGKYLDAYDVGEFLHSDALDILVAQSAYGNRGPGIPFGQRIPFASFHLHGKMYLDEIDFRTWNVIGNDSEISQMGLGCSMDLPMWKSAYRRAVGRMVAGGMGWWLYDMENGWYDNPLILADISDSLREIAGAGKGQDWHPTTAVVVDERNVLENVNLARRVTEPEVLNPRTVPTATAMTYRKEWVARRDYGEPLRTVVGSGVPYDVWMAEDFFANPSLADRYKALAWMCCIRKGPKLQKFVRDFEAKGGKVIFNGDLVGKTPADFYRFAREAGAYVPTDRMGLQVDMGNGFLSVHCLVPGRYDFKLPHRAKVVNLKNGLSRETGSIVLDMVAGETRWYALSKGNE